jgi:hypothetical protein
MKTLRILTLLTLTLALSGLVHITAQNPVLIKDESSVTISGTSSLHAWHENAEDFAVNIILTADDVAKPAIKKVSFTCKSASVISDNSLMTNKTHNALQVKTYPEITFTSDGQSLLAVNDGRFTSEVTGELFINGIKNYISIPFAGSFSEGKLTVKGFKSLKMSDYEIIPPTAIMGALKTGNDVIISFDLKFEIPGGNKIMALMSAINEQ